MFYDNDPTRSSGGFSLDDVARLYRRSHLGSRPRCPTCRAVMQAVSYEGPQQHMRLLRCQRCGRSVVFEQPAGDRAGAAD